MELRLSISLNCNIGRVRSNNEDMILVSGETYRNESTNFTISIQSGGRFVAAVADGMGGHNAGEIASEIVLNAFDDFIVNLPKALSDRDFKHEVDNEIKKLHSYLINYGETNAGCLGLGTTLAVWMTYENKVYILNAGDSRIYRLRNGILCQLSTDHSERNRANDHTLPSNLIYNCLGGGGQTAFVDIADISNKIFEEDIFMLCSDGVSDMLTEDDIESLLVKYGDADVVVEKAKQAGGIDNISVIVLKIDKID